jgi:putative homing endonuclease
MNYKRIYFKIIKNRRNNPLPPDVPTEKHHIKPRSFGGSNAKSNLVALSLREHFIVHRLLEREYAKRFKRNPTEKNRSRYLKMLHAVSYMAEVDKIDYKVTSHVYQKVRERLSEEQRIYNSENLAEALNFYLQNQLSGSSFNILRERFPEFTCSWGRFKIRVNQQLNIKMVSNNLYSLFNADDTAIPRHFNRYIRHSYLKTFYQGEIGRPERKPKKENFRNLTSIFFKAINERLTLEDVYQDLNYTSKYVLDDHLRAIHLSHTKMSDFIRNYNLKYLEHKHLKELELNKNLKTKKKRNTLGQ